MKNMYSFLHLRMDTSTLACTICFSDFHKHRKPLPCPGCAEDAEKICKACAQDHILTCVETPHCPICKCGWVPTFLTEQFKKDFIIGPLRKSRQEKALEREKGLLPQTMGLVEIEKKKKDMKGEIKKLLEVRAEIKKRYESELGDVDAEIRVLRARINGDVDMNVSTSKYILPCSKKKCNGFIESKSWKCGICETKYCRKCHEIKEKDHECDPNEVETAKAKMADTKPCPKCATRIYKIAGCDQMFCTSCHTAFSWNKGTIVTGTIHNPHYYELQSAMGAVRRAPGDLICGGVPGWYTIAAVRGFNGREDYAEFMRNVHRRAGEAQDRVAVLRQQLGVQNTEDIRVKYLMGEYKDENAFKKSIFLRERTIEKKREELNILETFVTVVTERFNEFITAMNETTERKSRPVVMKLCNDLVKILNFCNKAFSDNMKALQYNSFPQIVADKDRNYRFGGYKAFWKTEHIFE